MGAYFIPLPKEQMQDNRQKTKIARKIFDSGAERI